MSIPITPAAGPAPDPLPQPVETGTALVPTGITTYPLHPVDPSKIGDFWPSVRLVATPSGVAYLAYEDNSTTPVMVILLSQGASEDAAARDRLAGQVDRMDIDTVIARGGFQQDTGRLGDKFRSEADDPQSSDAITQSPWVALAFDGTQQAVDEARRVLADVDLSWLPQQGQPAGPDYRLHWTERVAPGLTRVWPLPWPGRRERGGRLTIVAAWLLVLLLAAIAILISMMVFSKAPPTTPPPPIPQTGSEPPDFPQTASPPPSSSPSPTPSGSGSGGSSESASPSGGDTPSESDSASPGSGTPSPSGSAGPGAPSSAIGSPSPPSRL